MTVVTRARPAALAVLSVAALVLSTAPAVDAAPARATTAATRAVSAASADARIATKLRSRLHQAALGHDVAVRVYDPGAGRTVFASQSLEAQLPASNMKLVTAFDVLTVLGPSTRLPTRVVNGTTAGSVVVVGGGDPLLSAADLRTLADRTVAALTAGSPTQTRPTGLKVSVDDSLFPRPTRPVGWTSAYGLGDISPVRALAQHGIASTDSTTVAMDTFVTRLETAGVAVDYVGRTHAPAPTTILAQVAGHRVDADVRSMLRNSDNQIAETLFRQVALATGRPATWAGAAAAARATLKTAGVPVTRLRLVDGSGLSRSDRVTAKALAVLVAKASAATDPRLATLVPSLPVAGRTGTLKHRFTIAPASCARGRVRAKTGFVNGVVALSGVTTGADGRPRVFSIVANHLPSSRFSVAQTQRAVDSLAATVTGCY